jgi:hypothetical protein
MADELPGGLLFVTSFNPELYQATGHKLVRTFLETHSPAHPADRLLVCLEGKCDLPKDRRLVRYDLGGDRFLAEWLAANADVIPDYLGGRAKECACPGRQERHARHKPRCHWSFMNRNASRFFRKVASYHALVEHPDAGRYALWLDSDTFFKQPLPHDLVLRALGGSAVFYFKGHRPAAETGILGFDLDRGAKAAVRALCKKFTSRDYLKLDRWDDGFVTTVVLRELQPKVRSRDLVHPTKFKGVTNHVLRRSEFSTYVEHMKGHHSSGIDLVW